MLDPEITDRLVRMGESETVCRLRVGETSGIKVHAHAVRFRPVDPAAEMLRLDFITIDLFAAELAVECVEIQPVLTGDERKRLVEVRPELICGAGFSGMISRHGDATTKAFAGVLEAADIITLPTMQRDRDLRQLTHCRLRIYADVGILGLGELVGLCDRLGRFSHLKRFISEWRCSLNLPRKASTILPKISTITPVRSLLRNEKHFHPDGFPICIERETQESEEARRHEFAVLVIVTGGKGLYVTGGDSWEITVGDIFVIPSGLEHAYRDFMELRMVNIHYQPTQLGMRLYDLTSVPGYLAIFPQESSSPPSGQLHLVGRELLQVTELTDRLEAELQAREAGFGFMAMALFMQITGMLSRCHDRDPAADRRARLRIAEALSHMERHLPREVGLDQLASIAQLSKRSFLRVFQAATGSSPLAWVIEQRIKRACHLLRQTDRRITEIAFDVGFNDSNYFTRQFTKITGISPRNYRLRQAVDSA